MKITFSFSNGTSQLILTPENARDKNYLDLCIDGRANIKLKPTTSDSTIIEFTESEPKSVEPVIIDLHEKVNLLQNAIDDSADFSAKMHATSPGFDTLNYKLHK